MKDVYHEIINSIEPLDLVFFRGADFVSNLISISQDLVLGSGEFTHVGIVVTKELLPNVKQLDSNKYYVLESTMSIPYPYSGPMSPNVISGEGKFGVQIRELEDTIKTYTATTGASVAWCKLKNNPYHSHTDRNNTIKIMKDIYNNIIDMGYEMDCLQLFGSLFSCVRPFRDHFNTIIVQDHEIIINNKIKNNWYFCSELVGLIYKRLGILPSYVNEMDIVPMDLLGYDQDHDIDIVDRPIYIKMN